MAYVSNNQQQQDEDESSNTGSVITGNNTSAPAPGSEDQGLFTNPTVTTQSGGAVGNEDSTAGTSPGVTAASVQATNPNSQSGKGNFTNLATYLDRNQEGAVNLGNTVGGSIQGQTDTAKNSVNTAANVFNTKVGQNTVNYDGGLFNNVANDASSYLDNNQVKQALQGTYTGPTDLTSLDETKKAQTDLTKAQTSGLLSENVGGRTQLMNELFNSGENTPKTTTGGLGLNQFLLQNTDEALGKVNTAATNAGATKDFYKGVLDTSLDTVKNAQNTNLSTRQQALDRLGQGTSDLQKQVTAALQQKQNEANAAAAARNARVQQILDHVNNGGQIDAGLAAELGLSAEQAAELQRYSIGSRELGGPGATVANYLSGAQAGQLGTADVVSADQQADLAALSALTGVIGSKFLYNGAGGGKDASINYSALLNDYVQQYQAGVERQRVAQEAAARAEAERQAQAARDAAAQQAEAAAHQSQQQQNARQWLANEVARLGLTTDVRSGYWFQDDGNGNKTRYFGALAPLLGEGAILRNQDYNSMFQREYGDSLDNIAGLLGGRNAWDYGGWANSGSMDLNTQARQSMGIRVPDPYTYGSNWPNPNNYNPNTGKYDLYYGGDGNGGGPGSAGSPGGPGGPSSVGGGVTGGTGIGSPAGMAAAAVGAVTGAPAGMAMAGINAIGSMTPNTPIGPVASVQGEGASPAGPGSSAPGGDPGNPGSSVGNGGSVGESGIGAGVGNGPGNGQGGPAGDSGDGGGGGSKIICTAMNEMYGLEPIRNRTWVRYSQTHLQPEHQVGYHKVFLPLVDYAFKQGDGYLNKKVRAVLEWIAISRTTDIENELQGKPRNKMHKYLRSIAEPTLYYIGKVFKDKK